MQTQLSPYDFPISYRLLISQQNKIGWRQLFHGRFATEWSRLHDDYTFHSQKQQQDGVYQRQLKGTRKRTGNQWCQDIASVLWSQWFVVWTQCHRTETEAGRRKLETITENLLTARTDGAQRPRIIIRTSPRPRSLTTPLDPELASSARTNFPPKHQTGVQPRNPRSTEH
jgi:hypothetical protein